MGIKMNSKDNKVYIVLGAPHSATSFISRILGLGGVNMGKFGMVSGRPYYYEDKGFRGVNKKILEEAGGTLQDPPSEEDILNVDLEKDIKRLLSRERGKFWGWKDPRTNLTVEKFLPHLDDDVYLICCFRRPGRLVGSYKGKSGFGKKFSKDILDRYNKAILKTVKEFCEL